MRQLRRALNVLAIVLVVIGAPATAAPPAPTVLTPDSMLSKDALLHDVDILQQAYWAMHPGLHRYNTPAQMRGHFHALRGEVDRDRTLGDAYLALSRFAATVKCGHTYANVYNPSKAVQRALFEGDDRVPFHFVWLGDRMVVTRDFSSDPAMRPGTGVLFIDGVPAAARQCHESHTPDRAMHI